MSPCCRVSKIFVVGDFSFFPILFYFSTEFNLSVNLMINQRNLLLDSLIGLQVGMLELIDHVEVLAVMVLDVVAA